MRWILDVAGYFAAAVGGDSTSRAAVPPIIRVLIVLACFVIPAQARAKDAKRLWYLSGDLAFHTTEDSVRSNADILYDLRPDDQVGREMSLQDGIAYQLSAGFGVSSLYSLQLDVGFFRGDIGSLDVYTSDLYPVARFDPISLSSVEERHASQPAHVGELTQIPVLVSGYIRFRKDRSLNPYIGGGVGVVFFEFTPGQEIGALNDRLASQRIIAVFDEYHNELTPPEYKQLKGMGKVPFTMPVSVSVDDSLEVHLLAGVEYFISDRVSIIGEARYSRVGESIDILMAGEDQITLSVWSEKLFRPDGSLKMFRESGGNPNPMKDPSDPSKGTYTCELNTTGDFDNDGHKDDLCYPASIIPFGNTTIQGGSINLSGYTAHLGLRFYF